MAVKKKKKPKYNQNTQIRSAIRRTFSRSPIVQEVKKDARVELPPKKLKNGKPGKKKQIRYTCAECSALFMGKDIAVDHRNPVIPVDSTFQTWDKFVKRLFCSKSNLQILCSYRLKDVDKHGGETSCHHKKTCEERRDRKAFTDKIKSIV